jgi:hypothetical protein
MLIFKNGPWDRAMAHAFSRPPVIPEARIDPGPVRVRFMADNLELDQFYPPSITPLIPHTILHLNVPVVRRTWGRDLEIFKVIFFLVLRNTE